MKLYIGNRFTGITVKPDSVYSEMYRIRQDGELSDMVNLSRAKDAAVFRAHPGGMEVTHWR